MRESRWEAEGLDREGLSESVQSCESCLGSDAPHWREDSGAGPGFCLFCYRCEPKLTSECIPVIPALQRLKQKDYQEFRGSLVYIESSRPAWTI